uniref:Ovule protein n=1 Tax=Heterorhabditis bacteriophora TaxID=37862 RepID=A0A1I7X2W4_HETBA
MPSDSGEKVTLGMSIHTYLDSHLLLLNYIHKLSRNHVASIYYSFFNVGSRRNAANIRSSSAHRYILWSYNIPRIFGHCNDSPHYHPNEREIFSNRMKTLEVAEIQEECNPPMTTRMSFSTLPNGSPKRIKKVHQA